MNHKSKIMLLVMIMGIFITSCQGQQKEMLAKQCVDVPTYDKSEFGNYDFIKIKYDSLSERNKTVPFYECSFIGGPENLEIYVNGERLVSNFINRGDDYINFQIDDYLLKSGTQKVMVKMLPLPGEEYLKEQARFGINIKVFDQDNIYMSRAFIMSFKSGQVIQKGEKLKEYVKEFTFEAETAHEIEAWQTGEDLRKMDPTVLKQKLQSYYCYLYQKILEGGHVKAMDEFEFKTTIRNIVLKRKDGHLSPTSYLEYYKLSDEKKYLAYLDFENRVLRFSTDGKLVWLATLEDEIPPVFVKNKDGNPSLYLYELGFYMPKGYKQLVPIR